MNEVTFVSSLNKKLIVLRHGNGVSYKYNTVVIVSFLDISN